MVSHYIYYDDPSGVLNVNTNIGCIGDKSIMGKFCLIVANMECIMNKSNHL